jgi:hypothetical protein
MNTTNVVKLPSVLEGFTKRIHKLMDDWSKNTIELGKELLAARENFPLVKGARPGWQNWIRDQVGIDPRTAYNFMKVAEKFGSSRELPAISRRILVMLAQDTVPDAGKNEVIERIRKGERVTARHAGKIIAEHRYPKPTEANKQAKETGQPVQASDGYIYFGTSKSDAQLGEDRRTVVYGVKDAIEALAEVELTPLNFIKFMLPHQRWDHNEEKKIEKARLWLNELAKEWNKWEED